MKKRSQKVCSLLLATLMAASALTGCGNAKSEEDVKVSSETQESVEKSEGKEETPVTDEIRFDGTVLTLMVPKGGTKGWDEQVEAINAITKEELGLTVEFIDYDYSDSSAVDLRYASNEKIDIMTDNANTYTKRALKGYFAEITDEELQKYAPNIWNTQYQSILEDPKIGGIRYAIGVEQTATDSIFVYRGDLADKYGITEMETIDDVEKYLLAVAENEPDIIPFDVRGTDGGNLFAMCATDLGWRPLFSGFGSSVFIDLDAENPAPFIAAEHPDYIAWIERMQKWNQAGVFSQSVLSNTTTCVDSFKAGRSAACFMNLTRAVENVYQELIQDERKDWDIRTMAFAQEQQYVASTINNVNVIKYDSPNKEASLAFLDLVYSNKELYLLTFYGIEGIHYELPDGKYASTGDAENSWFNLSLRRLEFAFADAATFMGHEELEAKLKSTAKTSKYTAFVPDTSSTELKTVYNAIGEVTKKEGAINKLGVFEGSAEEAAAAEMAALKTAGIDTYMEAINAQWAEFLERLK